MNSAPSTSPTQPEGCDRFRLPLGVQWIGRLRLDRVSNEPVRGCAEQRLTRRGALLQPGGDVDGVPDRERLALAGHDLARVDADAALDPDAPVAVELLVELAERSRACPRPRERRVSASSSCTTGTPNTAMTASPMNFSTVPPWRSIASRIASK